MQLLERCIADHDPRPMEVFIEAQLVLNPPPIELLRDIAGDVVDRLQNTRHGESAAMVAHLYAFIMDWVRGLDADAARYAARGYGMAAASNNSVPPPQ